MTSKSKTHHSTINTSSSYNRNNLFMNFKLIRGFSIKGFELNSKRVINPKLEKKNLSKKKSTHLVKKSNSNLKNNLNQIEPKNLNKENKENNIHEKNNNKKEERKNYLEIIKEKDKEINSLKKQLSDLKKFANNNNNKKIHEKTSSKNSIILSNSNGKKEREKKTSFDINYSDNEKMIYGNYYSPKKNILLNNNTLSFSSFSYNNKGNYNSPNSKKTCFSKLNLHNFIKKKSYSKDINKTNRNNNKNNNINNDIKEYKCIFENLLVRTKNLFERLKK